MMYMVKMMKMKMKMVMKMKNKMTTATRMMMMMMTMMMKETCCLPNGRRMHIHEPWGRDSWYQNQASSRIKIPNPYSGHEVAH